jgi:hypothetical protein
MTMKIEISGDGLIPLVIKGKEAMIDPWLFSEQATEAMMSVPDTETNLNAKTLEQFNALLAKYELPPVSFQQMAQIRIQLGNVVDEIKKKDGWAITRSTTPNSSSSTESTSSPSPPDSATSSTPPCPPSGPANG